MNDDVDVQAGECPLERLGEKSGLHEEHDPAAIEYHKHINADRAKAGIDKVDEYR